MTIHRLVNGVEVALSPEEEAALPPPPRLMLAKIVLVARVEATGKIDAVFAWLMSRGALFARWTAVSGVFADDQGLLDALAGGGLTAEEIATVTAAP